MKPASGQPPDEQRGIQAGKYGGSRNPTRVERLLRDRELRKINRAFQQKEAGSGVGGGGQAKPEHPPENSVRDVGSEPDEEIIDGSLAPITTIGVENRRSRGRPMRQRLLVVANRLPVSAVRRGEDSWYLEVSAGGLVSALLGKLGPPQLYSLLSNASGVYDGCSVSIGSLLLLCNAFLFCACV